MGRIAVITILFIISTMAGYGQTQWSIKAGANVANVNLNNEYEDVFDTKAKNRLGYQLGLMAQRELSETVYLRAEIYYIIKGYKYNRSNLDAEAKNAFNYISLPVFFGYNVTPALSVFTGPQIGLLGPAYFKQKNRDRINLHSIVDINNIDVGVGGGIAYTITPHINMDISIPMGLVPFQSMK